MRRSMLRGRPLTPDFADVLVAYIFLAITAITSAAERIELEVRETAGLARRGFPVHSPITLPRPVPVTTKFRLVFDGKPVVAQFRPDRVGDTANWWLDFQSDMSPNESKRFVVEFGDDVSPESELARGHKLTETEIDFSIAHAPYITWKFPKNLKSLVQSVKFESFEFMHPDSPGLLLRDRESQEFAFAGTGRVVRQGPMTVALRYEKTEETKSLQDVRSTVDLTLPGPVSWVEVEWTIDDPWDKVGAVGMQLNLHLDRTDTEPILVDFGTTGVVYLSLYRDQAAEMMAGPRKQSANSDGQAFWEIRRRDAGREWQFATQPRQSDANHVDGWAHVMDRKKCLALAIDAFARDTLDRIGMTADGKVIVWRDYPSGQKATRKQLRLWLHFVNFPPQSSAGTSPQQMQSPLELRIVGP